jgi:transposase-like protein
LSYRDVEELLAERGLHADHVTVWGWVQRWEEKRGWFRSGARQLQ